MISCDHCGELAERRVVRVFGGLYGHPLAKDARNGPGANYEVDLCMQCCIKMHQEIVKLTTPKVRCPEVIKGEQCGRTLGHEGKHQWERGD